MRSLLIFIFLLMGSFAFADQDADFREMVQKDLWAFQQVSEMFVPPTIFTPPPVHHKARLLPTPTTVSAPVIEAPTVKKFARETPWCSVKVTITDKHGSYNFNVQSDAPITGWEINTDKKVLLKSGDENQMYLFGVDMNQPFTNNLVLTLFVFKDNQTNPIYINLF